VLAFTPEPASVPFESVSGTDVDVYQGPPESVAEAPVGPAVSGVNVKALVYEELVPAPFAPLTVWAPDAVADAFHV
jgi:hypothetical protein